MAQVLDYSAGRPSGAAISDAGFVGAVRYIYAGGMEKRLTAEEATDLRSHGVGVAVVVQGGSNMASGSHANGVEAALGADAEATSLGLPGVPIYFAVDFDALPDQVLSFFQGVSETLGYQRTGIYGSYRITTDPALQKLCKYRWQTAAWSGGAHDMGANIYQNTGTVTVDGVACDTSTMLQQDFGQFEAEEGFLMALSDAQQAAMYNVIVNAFPSYVDSSISLSLLQYIQFIDKHVDQLSQDVKVLQSSQTNDDSALLTAVKALPTENPGLTDMQIASIASAVSAAVASNSKLNPGDIAAVVANVLADKLGA